MSRFRSSPKKNKRKNWEPNSIQTCNSAGHLEEILCPNHVPTHKSCHECMPSCTNASTSFHIKPGSAKNNQSPGCWNSCWCYLGSKLKVHRSTDLSWILWHTQIQCLQIVDALWSNNQVCKNKQTNAKGLEHQVLPLGVAWKHMPRHQFANHTMFLLVEIVRPHCTPR